MNVSVFLENVRMVAANVIAYSTGGDGTDGTCDCVGLIMGALGGMFDLHSSNYFARFQMRSLDPLLDESQLHEGSIVYKSRRDTAQLNERYQPGGRYYNGDMLDYYHVGVVTGIDPLEITHCTKSETVNGITCDDSIAKWSHFGDLLKVELDLIGEEPSIPETHDLAVVYTEDGKSVRLRSMPSTSGEYNTIAKVPYGAQVEILERSNEWATVRWNGQRGYMMDKFLRVIGAVEANQENKITLTISAGAAMELYEALSGVL